MSTELGVRGRFVDLVHPKLSDFETEDIARTLAARKRFNAVYDNVHSIAQHAVLVAAILTQMDQAKHIVFAGLHHDDVEAILGEVTSPVKRLCPDFLKLENTWNEVLNMRYMIDIHNEHVKKADLIVLANEVHTLLPKPVRKQYTMVPEPEIEIGWNLMEPWSENKAYFQYMESHFQLERYLNAKTARTASVGAYS